MLPFILVVVFLGTFGVIVASYTFLNRRALARQLAAKRRIQSQGYAADPDVSIWRDTAASAIPALNHWLDQLSHTEWLRRELRFAGVGTRPGEIMMGAAVMGLAAFVIGLFALGSRPLAVVAGLLVAAIPYAHIRRLRRIRLHNFEEQLPDAMEMLVNAMRSGYSFQAAMEFVGRETAAPLGEEFGRFHEEHRLGVDVRTALLNLQDRLPSVDLKMFATAVLIQRAGIVLIAAISNLDDTCASVQKTCPGVARGDHAIEHIYALTNSFDNILRPPYAHQIARFIVW